MSVEIDNNKKVLVIGIDGATFDLMKPWINEGRLPHLSNIMRGGVHGHLKSTFHPTAAAAWTSFMTGKNQGKHGVFDFNTKVPGSYDARLMDSGMRGAESLWNLLSAQGKKVGVINVPLTYPPEKVNGFLIPCIEAPGTTGDFAFPPKMLCEIKKNVGKYILTANPNQGLDNYLKDILAMIENSTATAQYLMQAKEWDFFMVVFTAADRVQQAFWKYMDKNHPGYNPESAKKYGNVIRDVYEKIDEKVGYLTKDLPEDVRLVIVSGHGAGPLKGMINLNRWLEQKGLLQFKRSCSRPPAGMEDLNKSGTSESPAALEFKSLKDTIDWANTKAFAYGACGNIWINVKGREAGGIVESSELYAVEDCICTELPKLTDNHGQKVVEKVYRKDELYRGDFVDRALDILVRWVDHAYHNTCMLGAGEKEIFSDAGKMPPTNPETNSSHKEDGIFIAKGMGIKNGEEIKGAEIIDMAPTIFRLMGLPIPADMDGMPLDNMFESDKGEKTDTGEKDSSYEGYSESDAKKVEERLRNLGYI
ncbi:MAG: alkaline phosphatase family protein [Planctomycetota bacterium]